MSVEYRAVGWNPQKKTYDIVLAAVCIGYLAIFVGFGAQLHPSATVETLLIRALGTLAVLLVHVILSIGPACRLDQRFLPLLYNRRHLGVALFLVALIHGVFSLIQFHALGDTNLLVSLLLSNRRFTSVPDFPFEWFGLAALLILFLMAATSHDFWLHNLTPPTWKRLHMSVYAAYALVFAHVCFGALQSETSPLLPAMLAGGATILSLLHWTAAAKERRADLREPTDNGQYTLVCSLSSIPEARARVVTLGDERIAIFRNQGRVSALSNVCRHQNGPLGEGHIVNGCVTCPWHGYQYDPETGASPPPFNDQVATFPVRIVGDAVWVRGHPR